MSLNPCEQLLFDYVDGSPEERQYWLHKVQKLAAASGSSHLAAERLDADLWNYFLERSAVVALLRDFIRREGVGRTSMRNLAEYWLRLWVGTQARKPSSPPPHSGG